MSRKEVAAVLEEAMTAFSLHTKAVRASTWHKSFESMLVMMSGVGCSFRLLPNIIAWVFLVYNRDPQHSNYAIRPNVKYFASAFGDRILPEYVAAKKAAKEGRPVDPNSKEAIFARHQEAAKNYRYLGQ